MNLHPLNTQDIVKHFTLCSCADPETRGGPTLSSFFAFFLVDERGNDPNTTESGSSSARQRNAIKMAFCWRADDGPTFNACLVALWFFQGIRTSIAKKPYFVIFQGEGVRTPCPPILDPRMYSYYYYYSDIVSVCRGPCARGIYSTHGTPSFTHPLWLQKRNSGCILPLSYAYLS